MRASLLAAIAMAIAVSAASGCGKVKTNNDSDGGLTGQVTALAVTPASPSAALGATVQFTATATLDDGTTADVTSQADWSSSDDVVATIAPGGLATTVGTGAATITATIQGISDGADLTVGPPTLDSIDVAPASQTIAVGQFADFTATAHYSNGPLDITAQATWESETPAVATASTNPGEAGRFYAVGGGSARVRATLSGVSGTADLSVDQAPLGSDPSNPGLDCTQIRDAGTSVGNGIYWLDSDGDGDHTDAFQAYCDMTTDGGGWTLLTWTGNSAVTPLGVPYPGLAPCPTLDCLRGSAVGAPQAQELIQRATEFGKGQQDATIASFQPLGAYTYGGKYTYGAMSGIVLNYGPTNCVPAYHGWFRSIGGPATYDLRPVYLNQALAFAGDYSVDANSSYIWNVGAPNTFCDSTGAMPGTWMGTFSSGQYGPYQQNLPGANSVWVRGGSVPEPVGSQINPGLSCREIQQFNASNPSGVYWIAPGGTTPFQVYCDMITAGGGWTLTYYVDAAHFDALYANNVTSSTVAPTGLNSNSDVWNVENVLPFSETLFGCSQDNEAAIYYWTYSSQSPQLFFDTTTATAQPTYQNNFPSTSSNTTAAGCIAETKNTSYAFMVLESSATCGSCSSMLFGMYHYPSGGGCFNSGTPISHNSLYDGRSIYYPVCNGAQTTNGRIWMGVR